MRISLLSDAERKRGAVFRGFWVDVKLPAAARTPAEHRKLRRQVSLYLAGYGVLFIVVFVTVTVATGNDIIGFAAMMFSPIAVLMLAIAWLAVGTVVRSVWARR